MSLVRAIAISSALHAATLLVAGDTVGVTAQLTRTAAPPLAVDFAPAETVQPTSSVEPAAVAEAGSRLSESEPSPRTFEQAAEVEAGTRGIVLPTYFPINALTRLPEPLTDLDALLPRRAEPQPGNLELVVWLGRDGLVDKVEILRSEIPDGMARAALDAFTRMRFRPGEIRGTAVPSRAEVVVQFAAEGPPVAAGGVTPTQAR